jgi:dATP pyrophosphohydrolase
VAGFRRPESVLVVIHASRSILLLHRVTPFSFWQSVTGSVDQDEMPADAASRELKEETGLSSDGQLSGQITSRQFTIDRRWRNRYAPGITENVEHEFRFQVEAPVDIHLDRHEHDAWEWVDINEAIERVWSWTNKAALLALRDGNE